MSVDGHDRRELAEWMRQAYAGGADCPPPEVFLEAEWSALDTGARQAIERHLASCAACRAEQAMAQAFDAEETDAEAADVDWVVAQLRQSHPERAEGPPVAGRKASTTPVARLRSHRSPTMVATWARIAAATVLLLGGGIALRLAFPGTPPLPPPSTGAVVRAGDIEVVSPAGQVRQAPDALRWNPVPTAAGYRVRLLGVDDRLLWEGRVADNAALLPQPVISRLAAAVSYTWTVEALDASGVPLGRSGTERFRIVPPPEASPPPRRSP